MKIQLNNNEQYEIKLPEQTDLQGLYMIAARFNSLLKNFSKFNIMDDKNPGSSEIILGDKEIRHYTKQNRKDWQFLRENRKTYVEILNCYYNNTVEEFQNLVAKYNLTILKDKTLMSSASGVKIRELHNIKPGEVGLIRFPSRKEQIETLRIKNKK